MQSTWKNTSVLIATTAGGVLWVVMRRMRTKYVNHAFSKCIVPRTLVSPALLSGGDCTGDKNLPQLLCAITCRTCTAAAVVLRCGTTSQRGSRRNFEQVR